jgi:hypothetical protein
MCALHLADRLAALVNTVIIVLPKHLPTNASLDDSFLRPSPGFLAKQRISFGPSTCFYFLLYRHYCDKQKGQQITATPAPGT